jgi:hypothetical protein
MLSPSLNVTSAYGIGPAHAPAPRWSRSCRASDAVNHNQIAWERRPRAKAGASLTQQQDKWRTNMNIEQFLSYGASTTLTLVLCGSALVDEKGRIVRLAKLQIDAAQLESYKAVSEKDNPAHITIFEMYADADAYKAHLETPHFKKYKSATQKMVKSLELVETVPIFLGTKAK